MRFGGRGKPDGFDDTVRSETSDAAVGVHAKTKVGECGSGRLSRKEEQVPRGRGQWRYWEERDPLAAEKAGSKM